MLVFDSPSAVYVSRFPALPTLFPPFWVFQLGGVATIALHLRRGISSRIGIPSVVKRPTLSVTLPNTYFNLSSQQQLTSTPDTPPSITAVHIDASCREA